MRVFKNYFKIAWGHRVSILLYTVIFFILMSFFVSSDNSKEEYKSVDVNIYLKDNANTKLSKALHDYLDKNADIKQMDESLVEDNLFYGRISATVELGKDFDSTKEVLFKSAPNDMYAMSVKEKINSFLSQVSAYESAGFTEEEAIKNTDVDLAKKYNVGIKAAVKEEDGGVARFYFNFLNYIIIAQVLLIVSSISSVYKSKPILMRNSVSPISNKRINFELMLGNIVTGLMVWLVYMIFLVVIYKYDFTVVSINLMMLNSFIFTIAVVAMAVMIASLIRNTNAIQGVMNIVSLGSSFLCGAFVPQEVLGDTALAIGKLLPSYYYIRNNEMLAKSADFSLISMNLLIIAAFALVFIVITALAKPRAELK